MAETMAPGLPADTEVIPDLRFVWLEITGRCQLECVHCYAESGPTGTHGTMNAADWRRVIDECADLGVAMVQFIGGEPTLHSDLPELVDHALAAGLEVEVFSNLVHVGPVLWETFGQPGVRLACSYYSDDPAQHASITGRPSHARTRANIIEALRRAIPVRVGVIALDEEQRVEAALAELTAIGVTDVGYDRLRQVGRGVRDQQATMNQLCGNCADGVLAVAPDGTVWPCVFTRWMPVGSVLDASLRQILCGAGTRQARAALAEHFGVGRIEACDPNCQPCGPNCNPNCNPACNPCQPRCNPSCHPSCNPACQPTCGPSCSPSCNPINCQPNCWPSR